MRRGNFVAVAISLSLLILNGCGPQEKPESLVKLEQMRNDEASAEINGLAPEAYKKCTDLTNQALDSWQEGEQEQAIVYAELGQRQYITAQASSVFKEADTRREAAVREYHELNSKMAAMQSRVVELNASIDATKTKISDADPNNSEVRIQLAMTEREKAVQVEAGEFAKADFEAGDAKLKEASNKNVKGERRDASTAAEEARVLFAKAYETAKPSYEQKMAAVQSAERFKAMIADAKVMFDTSTLVTTDTRETIIVVKGAFEKNGAELSSASMDLIRKSVELLNRYPEATVRVEGHAQKTSKDAYGISARRAEVTSRFLSGQGIGSQRISTEAKGKTFLRYDEKQKGNAALNDRVEIVITMP